MRCRYQHSFLYVSFFFPCQWPYVVSVLGGGGDNFCARVVTHLQTVPSNPCYLLQNQAGMDGLICVLFVLSILYAVVKGFWNELNSTYRYTVYTEFIVKVKTRLVFIFKSLWSKFILNYCRRWMLSFSITSLKLARRLQLFGCRMSTNRNCSSSSASYVTLPDVQGGVRVACERTKSTSGLKGHNLMRLKWIESELKAPVRILHL